MAKQKLASKGRRGPRKPAVSLEQATERFGPAGLGDLIARLRIDSGDAESKAEWYGDGIGADVRAWHEQLDGGRAQVGDFELLPLPATTMAEVQSERAADGCMVARLRSIFCGAVLIAKTDEEAVLASVAGSTSGASKVYRAHQDEWDLAAADISLASWLYGELQDETAPTFEGEDAQQADAARAVFKKAARAEKLPPYLDPRALWRRSDWLVDVFFQINIEETDAQLGRAAPYRAYAAEKDEIAKWPHLACYWLCSHYFFGNDEELEEALELAAGHRHPAVVELRQARGLIREGATVMFGRWSVDELVAKRTQLVDDAPTRLLGPGAKARRKAVEALDAARARG